MNNNINEQNNQGMNNNINMQNNLGMNNTIPSNESQTFVNNTSQIANQTFENHNINHTVSQPNQTFMDNNFNSSNNVNQNNLENMQTPNYTQNSGMTNNNMPNNNKKNKINIKKIIIILVIILGIIVVISLLSNSSKSNIPSNPSAKLTLTCTVNVAMSGVYYTDTYDMYINDSSVSTKQTYRMDLKKTQVNGDESEWTQSRIDGLSTECKSTPECKFDYDYSKGNYFETITFLEEEFYSEGVQGLTAEEIYDLFKTKFEGGNLDGLIYTCSENGPTTNNESVYKTIDFNSYTGDIESTEFDILFNKKVTFTNVPTLGGMFGNLTKSIFCDNESSFTIEDDAKYTITGIVTLNQGTNIVKLKDCTITKSN